MRASDLHRLSRLLRAVAIEVTADPGEQPLAVHELAIVEDVARHPASPMAEIVRRTGVAQSMVSQAVAVLRDAGALATERDPADGRRVLVSVRPELRDTEFVARGSRPVTSALQREFDLDESGAVRVEALLDEVLTMIAPPGGAADASATIDGDDGAHEDDATRPE